MIPGTVDYFLLEYCVDEIKRPVPQLSQRNLKRKSISNVGPNVHANPYETDLFENLCSSDYRFIFL